ncbi:LysR family transcriptional regulator [Psychromonas aquatilis]|uniref:LysR family transcriptional regulator n=1 Tax=Psychromonas aquatilis TaxID=2005072 RepID=A0ABU9GS40_9GAMM
MIELSHLKIMIALHEKETLTLAADSLCLTQSALSHQIRSLEKRLNIKLWQRYGRRLRLTPAGELLLKVAKQTMPTLEQTEMTLKAMGEGLEGSLRIGVECYPCQEWLTQVVADFLDAQVNIDIDIINKLQFFGISNLLNQQIDILITPDIFKHKELQYYPLFEYEQVLLVSESHSLVDNQHIKASDLADQTLFTFPIEKERLDVFKQFLWPNNIAVKVHKKIESLSIMLQMVEHQRGICVLPEWLADSYSKLYKIKKIRLGKKGIYKTLYAAIRKEDQSVPYLQEFIELGIKNAM